MTVVLHVKILIAVLAALGRVDVPCLMAGVTIPTATER